MFTLILTISFFNGAPQQTMYGGSYPSYVDCVMAGQQLSRSALTPQSFASFDCRK